MRRLSALDRKLLRDLLGMKGQAVAIGLVLAIEGNSRKQSPRELSW